MGFSFRDSFHFAYVMRLYVVHICEQRAFSLVIYLEIYISVLNFIFYENSHTYPFFTEIVYDIANS